jgi:hypothetical protein
VTPVGRAAQPHRLRARRGLLLAAAAAAAAADTEDRHPPTTPRRTQSTPRTPNGRRLRQPSSSRRPAWGPQQLSLPGPAFPPRGWRLRWPAAVAAMGTAVEAAVLSGASHRLCGSPQQSGGTNATAPSYPRLAASTRGLSAVTTEGYTNGCGTAWTRHGSSGNSWRLY